MSTQALASRFRGAAATTLLAGALLALGGMQTALAQAGRFVFAQGPVSITDKDGARRVAARGTSLFPGDTINTGAGRAQVRWADGGRMSLRPGTEFRIDEYRYTDGESEQDRSVFSLLKGGLRAITGAIGKKFRNNYRLVSPVATIGIRGTDFDTDVTDDTQTVDVGQDPKDPDDEGIDFFNALGNIPVLPGQSAIARIGQGPDYSGQNGEVDTGGNAAPDTDNSFVSGDQRDSSGGQFVFGGGDAQTLDGNVVFLATTASDSTLGEIGVAGGLVLSDGVIKLEIDVAGETIAFDVPFPDCPDCGVGEAGLISGFGTTIVEQGSNADYGVQWLAFDGDFSGDVAAIVGESGGFNLGRFHVLTAPDLTPFAQLPTTGFTTYANLIGGTSATHSSGAVATNEFISIGVDFTSAQVVSFLAQADFANGGQYSLSNTSSAFITPYSTAGLTIAGSCNAAICGPHQMLGGKAFLGFVGPHGEAIAGSLHAQYPGTPSHNAFASTFLVEQGGGRSASGAGASGPRR